MHITLSLHIKIGILKNLDAAFSMFTNAQQWESFLPSIFSPFTPTAKAPQTYPVKEFFCLSADVVIEKYLYWENTIGIAPYFALIYLRLMENFHESSDDLKGSTPGVLAVIVENMNYHSSLCWDHLQHTVSPLKSVLSDAEMNALSLLTTLFLAVLLALYFRSHNRIRQPHWSLLNMLKKGYASDTYFSLWNERWWAVLYFAVPYNARTLRNTLQRSVTDFLFPCLNVLIMFKSIIAGAFRILKKRTRLKTLIHRYPLFHCILSLLAPYSRMQHI